MKFFKRHARTAGLVALLAALTTIIGVEVVAAKTPTSTLIWQSSSPSDVCFVVVMGNFTKDEPVGPGITISHKEPFRVAYVAREMRLEYNRETFSNARKVEYFGFRNCLISPLRR